MRGFRGNRAIQNQFSSRYGNQGVGASYQPPVKDSVQGNGTASGPRTELPDWMKTPETLAAEKGTAKVTAAAGPAVKAPPKLRVIEGGAAKTKAKAKIKAKAPASGKKASAPSKSRKLAVVPARKGAGRQAA